MGSIFGEFYETKALNECLIIVAMSLPQFSIAILLFK